MTIEEAKAEKIKLQTSIGDLIVDFSNKTGLTVDSVYVKTVDFNMVKVIARVEIQVSL